MFLFNNKEPDDILNKLLEKDKLKRYLFLIIGTFLLAVTFNVFYAPNNLVTGGISGISIVINRVFGINKTLFIVISYIILLIISLICLGKEKTRDSLIGSLLYPLFVFLTENLGQVIQFDVNNMLLIVIFGALLNGIGSGLTFKYGFSTGGGDIVWQIISKYFKISIGDAMKLNNLFIILIAGFFLNNQIYAWENVMYAIIIIYIVSILNDKVLLGVSNSKSFYIITEHETAIKHFLMKELGMGVTVLEGRGGYTGDRKKVLLCVIPTKEYFLAKEGILELDKDAIVLINDVYQSSGIE